MTLNMINRVPSSKLACSSMSLHMQLNRLACSTISLHAFSYLLHALSKYELRIVFFQFHPRREIVAVLDKCES